MRALVVSVVVLVLLTALPGSGAQRVVLVEQFTNHGCPGCNDIKTEMSTLFLDNYDTGKIVPVLTHTYWPQYSDSFFLFDSLLTFSRLNLYYTHAPWDSFLYVPSFRFDGAYLGDPSDFATLADWYAFFQQTVDSLVTVPSPIRIEIRDNWFRHTDDAVDVSFDVIAESDLSFPMKLHLAVTERRHRLMTFNGKHFFPLRDFVPDNDGYDIASMNAGDSLHFEWTYPTGPDFQPDYWLDRLLTNIFIQRVGTREVLQAASAALDPYAGIDVADVSSGVTLGRNTPNPFTSKTTISYSLRQGGNVSMSVYTLTGRLVTNLVDGYVEPGVYSVTWDGRDRFGHDVGGGVYYYSLKIDEAMQTGKMILLR